MENICPYCKSNYTKKKGLRKNKSGNKQTRWCNKCQRRYTPDDGFWKMKHKPEIIGEALSCYKRGMSLKDVKEHLSDYRETKVSRKTILLWLRKYSKILKSWSDKQKPKIKGPIHLDELIAKVKKMHGL